jgi:uncharacterized caspase-like protein
MLSAAGGAAVLRLVVLDASHANPFKDRMRRSQVTRDVTDRGFAPPPESQQGTLVIYSAKEGEVAEEGADGDNPFARAFIAKIKVPGLEVRRLFDVVRDNVMAATQGRQQPSSYGTLPGQGEYYFVPGKQGGG